MIVVVIVVVVVVVGIEDKSKQVNSFAWISREKESLPRAPVY